VRSYEGGDCFYLHPLNVTNTSVLVEGFGSSPSPFAAFDEDFKKVFGFEPNISLRQVNDSQCASVAFLKTVGIDVARGPKLQIDAFNLKAGETLSGSVEGYGARHIEVILVADDGYVHVLSDYLKREGQNATFRLKPERTSGAQRSRPQLVIAVASPQPLALLSTGKPISGDTLFPLLADEIRRLGSTVDIAVKYFRLE
jgi:serine/threonine-protein kinase